MSAEVLQSLLQKWLDAQPAQRLSLAYAEGPEHAGHLALVALQQQWIDAAYGIGEPQVAQRKLNWWAEELAGAAASGGRHPLTQALFAAPQIVHITAAHWLAPIQAAMMQHDAATAADFSEQYNQACVFHGALARLETCWWFGADADPVRAEILATTNHLLHTTARLQECVDHECLVLPMACLARHGLDRPSLAADGPQRRAAVRDQLDDIQSMLLMARARSAPLALFRGLQMRENTRLLRRALRAADPLARLRSDRVQASPGSVFRAWAAARDWHRHDKA